MRCKNYYKLFNNSCVTEPTGVKNWKQKFPNSAFTHWKDNFAKIYKISKDNILRQFQFKLMYRITVTRKELLKFKITTGDQFPLLSNHDSIIHTFTECAVTTSIYSSALNWFNYTSNVSVNPSTEPNFISPVRCRIQFDHDPRTQTRSSLRLCAKQYIYDCKIALKTPILQNYRGKSKRNGKLKLSSNWIKLVWLQTLLCLFPLYYMFTYLFCFRFA